MVHLATLYLDRLDAVIFDAGSVVVESEHGVVPYQSSVALARELRNCAVWTAVICASHTCAQKLAGTRVDGLFDVRVDGVDVARLGLAELPNPALFEEAARRLHVRPARCAVIEDVLTGVEAGYPVPGHTAGTARCRCAARATGSGSTGPSCRC